MSWDEIIRVHEMQSLGFKVQPVDISTPAPFKPEDGVVFVAIDLEFNEMRRHVITEIGVSILDTLDIEGIAPGKNGEFWAPIIQKRHFRIYEWLHHKNHRWVSGCPDKFEFGESEIIDAAAIRGMLQTCLRPPFGITDQSSRARKLVLVGHSFKCDVEGLRRNNISLYHLADISHTIDTADIYRALAEENKDPALGIVLKHFDIIPWHLHNAGNDAAYTMLAMLAIAVSHAESRLEELVTDGTW